MQLRVPRADSDFPKGQLRMWPRRGQKGRAPGITEAQRAHWVLNQSHGWAGDTKTFYLLLDSNSLSHLFECILNPNTTSIPFVITAALTTSSNRSPHLQNYL